jgi:hypothetical protein
MTRITVKQFCTAVLLLVSLSAAARTSENFNSRKGVSVHDVKANLQNLCWTFHHFDINNNGWNPGLEGDGAMVSDSKSLQHSNSGIYTPLLNVTDNIDISFDYRFSENFSGEHNRWIKICLTNSANEIVSVLDKIEFNGASATKPSRYSTSFKNIRSGEYRLVLLYGGSGGTANIAIDELNVSASFKYDGGCNTAPVALKDKIKGAFDRTAQGSLLANDRDNNRESLKAYLVKGSDDGTIELKENGSFAFVPRQGFKGHSTSFVYKICDEGAGNLCSSNTTVNISFPSERSLSRLAGFKGSYKMNGNVELEWNTESGNSLDKFELERSMNGREWKSAGIIMAASAAHNGNDYTYTDKVNRNKAHKKDLYYRLKHLKSDGSTSTSRLLIVRVYNTRTVTMISVTPNPSKSDIAVNVQLHEPSYVSMKIFDEAGTTVIRKIVEAGTGTSNILIEKSSSLTPGLYTLEVIVNSKERMLVKLIKE